MSMTHLMSNEEKLSRVGKKWLPEEDTILLTEITDKKTFEEIAFEHRRTITGIKSRVISKILYPKYKKDNISLDDLSSEYNIEKDLVEKYINKIETTNANKKYVEQNKSDDNKEETIEAKPKINRRLLFEKIISLETKMLAVEQKLDYIISIISK